MSMIEPPFTEEEVKLALRELFKQEALCKEELRRKERKDEHGEERPILPWTHYTLEELVEWFEKEVEELREAIKSGNQAEISDECLDVSNFAFFIWAFARYVL